MWWSQKFLLHSADQRLSSVPAASSDQRGPAETQEQGLTSGSVYFKSYQQANQITLRLFRVQNHKHYPPPPPHPPPAVVKGFFSMRRDRRARGTSERSGDLVIGANKLGGKVEAIRMEIHPPTGGYLSGGGGQGQQKKGTVSSCSR